MKCHCLQNYCQPDIQLSIYCLHEFLLPPGSVFPVIFLSQSPANMPFSPWWLNSPFPLIFFHPFIKSLHLNLPQLSEMSASTMLPLLFLSSLPPYSPYLSSHISSSHSPVSSKRGSCLRSCQVLDCLNWKQLFPPSLMFPPTTLSHLSSSSTHPILPVCFPVPSFAFFMWLHLLCLCCLSSSFSPTLKKYFSLFLLEINVSVQCLSQFVHKDCGSVYTPTI